MAVCAGCHNQITGAQTKNQVVEKDEKGRLKAIWHNKCHHVKMRQARMKKEGRLTGPSIYDVERRTADDLTEEAKLRRETAEANYESLRAKKVTQDGSAELDSHVIGGEASLEDMLSEAEQQVALTRRQEELAADREQEPTRRGFADWRDPETVDIEDLSGDG